jgi:protein-L-isoaspartate O-methyltransferase
MADLELETAIAASGLVTGAVQSALVSALIRKNVISVEEGREIYEQALLLLESAQVNAPSSAGAFDAAREIIEQHLRP